jgi:hypothetical protein
MPLVKKQSGWFWGSKGPFDSKAKALSVARAAYASGYKGESNEVIAFDLSESRDKSVNISEKFKEVKHNLL